MSEPFPFYAWFLRCDSCTKRVPELAPTNNDQPVLDGLGSPVLAGNNEVVIINHGGVHHTVWKDGIAKFGADHQVDGRPKRPHSPKVAKVGEVDPQVRGIRHDKIPPVRDCPVVSRGGRPTTGSWLFGAVVRATPSPRDSIA